MSLWLVFEDKPGVTWELNVRTTRQSRAIVDWDMTKVAKWTRTWSQSSFSLQPMGHKVII